MGWYDLLEWLERVDKLGILPNAGGYLDQPAKFIEALDLLRLVLPAEKNPAIEALIKLLG